MTAQASLIDQLEEAIGSGSSEKRIETLRRITDLYLAAPAQFNGEQVQLFDDVFIHLVARVETKARAELAKRLAPVAQAPNEVIQTLARDDEISVAGPVLTQSNHLSTDDLVDIARQKGQAHLLAIAGRDQLEERLTDVLVSRGDNSVVHTLASNAGAAFSQSGYSNLVQRAGSDELLTEKLGRRLDIPQHHFRELLLKATNAVRDRLLASAGPDKKDAIRALLSEVTSEIAAPLTRNIADAQRAVQMMHDTGRLNEDEILLFARHCKYEEMMAGLALLCAVPFDLIDRLMHSDHTGAMLVPCKVAGLGWPTVRAMLDLRSTRRATSDQEIEQAGVEFGKLSKPTAARILRFWQVRQSAQAQAVG